MVCIDYSIRIIENRFANSTSLRIED